MKWTNSAASGARSKASTRFASKKTRPIWCSRKRRREPVPAARPCHYLWRGAMYVKHDGRVFPCCQSYMLDGAPVGDLREQRARGNFQFR